MPASITGRGRGDPPAWPLWGAALALTGLAAAALYQISFYLRLPVDLLGFAESPFIQDIIKLRLGDPIYTPPSDNNSYPYTPGAPLLTYGLASLAGKGDAIPVLRAVQFGYVLAAAAIGVGIARSLVRRVLPAGRGPGLAWGIAAGALLLLVAVDPRHNPYTHTLHNDGLALLVSALAYWVLVEVARRPRPWLFVASGALPALGFMVKQSLLIWLPLAALFFFVSGRLRPARAVLFGAAGILAFAGVVGACYALWGEPFLWWVFRALGEKTVSPARSALHLLEAGAYLVMGAIAGWWLVLRPGAARGEGAPDRSLAALWGLWLLLLLGESYTSGVAWVQNHLGPGVFLATCWLLAAGRSMWGEVAGGLAGWRAHAWSALLGVILVGMAGALGLIRIPANPVPPDLARYVAAIEAEFEGLPTERVLLDNGSWIYLRDGVSPLDRSSPVALHVGANQAEIAREHLAGTLARIREGRYVRILARELESERFPYDFQSRGSGVREALLERYEVVRTIPAVEGVDVWWPRGLLSELYVLEPRGP